MRYDGRLGCSTLFCFSFSRSPFVTLMRYRVFKLLLEPQASQPRAITSSQRGRKFKDVGEATISPRFKREKNTAGESPRQERKAYSPTGSRTQGYNEQSYIPTISPRHPSHTTHKWFHRLPTRPGKPNANSPDLPQPPPNCENLLRRRPRGPCPSTCYSGPPP